MKRSANGISATRTLSEDRYAWSDWQPAAGEAQLRHFGSSASCGIFETAISRSQSRRRFSPRTQRRHLAFLESWYAPRWTLMWSPRALRREMRRQWQSRTPGPSHYRRHTGARFLLETALQRSADGGVRRARTPLGRVRRVRCYELRDFPADSEIGIRMALGAQRGQVFGWVFGGAFCLN